MAKVGNGTGTLISPTYRAQQSLVGCNCGGNAARLPSPLGDVTTDGTAQWVVIGGLLLAATIGVFAFSMHTSK